MRRPKQQASLTMWLKEINKKNIGDRKGNLKDTETGSNHTNKTEIPK